MEDGSYIDRLHDTGEHTDQADLATVAHGTKRLRKGSGSSYLKDHVRALSAGQPLHFPGPNPASPCSSCSQLRLRGAFELRNVEFLHLKHGLHRLRLFDEVGKARGHDLPGKAELVLEPATLVLAASS
jgi:hypothetical protein